MTHWLNRLLNRPLRFSDKEFDMEERGGGRGTQGTSIFYIAKPEYRKKYMEDYGKTTWIM